MLEWTLGREQLEHSRARFRVAFNLGLDNLGYLVVTVALIREGEFAVLVQVGQRAPLLAPAVPMMNTKWMRLRVENPLVKLP